MASPTLTVGGQSLGLPGGGSFTRWGEGLRLTEPTSPKRSLWSLPGWMMHGYGGLPEMSYHGKPSRWERRGDRALLQTVGKGQEFVKPVGANHDAADWLRDLVAAHA